MKVIGEGLYPGVLRVIVHWLVDGKAETPIRIAHGFVRGEIEPNTDTVVPENIAQMLEQSGYDVLAKGEAPEEYQLADPEAAEPPAEPVPEPVPVPVPVPMPVDQPADEPPVNDAAADDDAGGADDVPPADDPVDPVPSAEEAPRPQGR